RGTTVGGGRSLGSRRTRSPRCSDPLARSLGGLCPTNQLARARRRMEPHRHGSKDCSRCERMHMSEGRFREERDSMGTMKVPEDALWGATTQRAVETSPVSGRPTPRDLTPASAHPKAACAKATRARGTPPEKKAAPITAAPEETARGEHDRHF